MLPSVKDSLAGQLINYATRYSVKIDFSILLIFPIIWERLLFLLVLLIFPIIWERLLFLLVLLLFFLLYLPLFSSNPVHTLCGDTLVWPYYFLPIWVTLTSFSRSQVTLKSKFSNFIFQITDKPWQIWQGGLKSLYYITFPDVWYKKFENRSCAWPHFLDPLENFVFAVLGKPVDQESF